MTSPRRNALKLVVVDRDGTLNVYRKGYIKGPQEWEPIPGAMEALGLLARAGWHVVVASNQPALGRGVMDMASLNEIHEVMHRQVQAHGGRIDAVFFCPHSAEESCSCRKPESGMFLEIAERYGVELSSIHAVGDALRDVRAASAAGCMVHLVCTGEGEIWRDQPLDPAFPPHTRVHDDFLGFAKTLLQEEEAAQAAQSASDQASLTP